MNAIRSAIGLIVGSAVCLWLILFEAPPRPVE